MKDTVLAFGEIMLRLAPHDGGTIVGATAFDACYGGTEANVLACLTTFGHNTEYVTALPETELGDAVVAHLKNFGVGTSRIARRGDILGIYFSEAGNGSRGSNVVYLRRFSEITRLDEHSLNFDKVFDGVSLFHISGISFALSESSRRLAFELIAQAKRRGIAVSFDFNYRAKLWEVATAKPHLARAAREADILLASTLDLEVFLDTTEEKFMTESPAKTLVVRDRKVINAGAHSVVVSAHRKTASAAEHYRSPLYEFDVKERIGGGDAFDGAMLHGLLGDKPLAECVEFAVAAFAYKHTVAGDTFVGTARDVEQYAAKLRRV